MYDLILLSTLLLSHGAGRQNPFCQLEGSKLCSEEPFVEPDAAVGAGAADGGAASAPESGRQLVVTPLYV
jgi:hypothetical protein